MRENLIGRKFHHLTILSSEGGNSMCLCDCGNVKKMGTSELTSGRCKTCGCGRPEFFGAKGDIHHPLFRLWKGMIRRCKSKTRREFHNYGGRGIKVCDRWLVLENFVADMGPRPSPKHSVDRIDNDGNYEPSNCRWATVREQALNKRTTKRYTFRGESLTISEWSDRTGISYYVLFQRITKSKWTLERAFTEPVARKPTLTTKPTGRETI